MHNIALNLVNKRYDPHSTLLYLFGSNILIHAKFHENEHTFSRSSNKLIILTPL